jgi:hypothetical protein
MQEVLLTLNDNRVILLQYGDYWNSQGENRNEPSN